MMIPKSFPKVERVCSRELSRYAIMTPWLEGDRMYATDGHGAVAVPIEREDTDTDGPIPVDSLIAARKVARQRRSGDRVVFSKPARVEANGTVALEDGRSWPRAEELTYPDVAGAIPPESREGPRVALDATLLRRVAEGLGSDVVELRFALTESGEIDDGCPIRVTPVLGEHKDAVGCLMPVSME